MAPNLRPDSVVNSCFGGRGRGWGAPGVRPGGWTPTRPGLLFASTGIPGTRPARERPRNAGAPSPRLPGCPAGLHPAHLPRRRRSPCGRSRCESRGAGAAKGRERRAAGWAPGPPPLPDYLARSLAGWLVGLRAVLSAPRLWAAATVTAPQCRAVGGGCEPRCACPAWGGAMLLYGSAPALTKGLGNRGLAAEPHRVCVCR